MSRLTTPPAWCKDAIPTPLGWRHPRTNELLISIRLDMSLFESKEEETNPEVEAPKQVEKATRQRKTKNV